MPAQRQKKGVKQNEAPSKQDGKPQRPQWPQLTPLLPKDSLQFEEVYPGQIVTISNFFTSTLCSKYVSFLSTLPLSTTPGKPKKGEAVRVNDRFAVDDPAFAEMLWSSTSLKELILHEIEDDEASGSENWSESKENIWGGEVCGLNSNIRIYKYSAGQFFDQHYDDSNDVTVPGAPGSQFIKARTTWTILLYLTSASQGCVGGETVFYPEKKGKKERDPDPVVATLETGKLLLHKHGKDCLLHEGREVTKGEKWVIRTDLCVKR